MLNLVTGIWDVKNICTVVHAQGESFPKRQVFFKLTIFFVLILFRMGGGWGGGQKASPTSFFPVTSTNVAIVPYNFLAFRFSSFGTLVQNFKFVSSASPKLLNLNQDHPSRKSNFSGQILIKLRL